MVVIQPITYPLIKDILRGERGPRRDMVLLNAAAAFVVAGLDSDLRARIERAAESIDSRRAKEMLERVIAFTQRCGHFSRYYDLV